MLNIRVLQTLNLHYLRVVVQEINTYYIYLEMFVGFMAVSRNITVYLVVTRCILLDMHPTYGATCSSEREVNLNPENGTIHSSN
jgi:hypothetical protein